MDRIEKWVRLIPGHDRRCGQRLGALALMAVLLLSSGFQPVLAEIPTPQDEDVFSAFIPNGQLAPRAIDEAVSSRAAPSAPMVSAAHIEPTESSLIVDSDFGVDDTVAVAALLSLALGIPDMGDGHDWSDDGDDSDDDRDDSDDDRDDSDDDRDDSDDDKDHDPWGKSTPVEIQGLVTVAGVTTVDNALYNAQLLLCQYGLSGVDLPVVRGAYAPWKRDLSSIGKLIHGPDGLWWLAQLSREQGLDEKCPPQDSFPTNVFHGDATHFYCGDAELNGTTLLVLGPLTNIANAIKECKQRFLRAEGLELVVLGGADMTGIETPPMGNDSPIIGKKTPVTEYNFWQDPEAARYVFDLAKPRNPGDDPRLNITLITQNAFDQYVISPREIGALATSSNAVGRWLTVPEYEWPFTGAPGPLPLYVSVQEQNLVSPTVPDLVAAAYAVDLSVRASSLVTPSIVDVFGKSNNASKFVSGLSLIAQSVVVHAVDPETGYEFDVPIGTSEQLAQLYDDQTLSALADEVFDSGIPFDFSGYEALDDFVMGALTTPLNNADVVAKIDPGKISEFLLRTLTSDYSPVTGASLNIGDEQGSNSIEFDEQIFLPLVGSE